MLFTDLWVFLLVIVLSVLCITLFMLAYLGTNFSIKEEEHYAALIQQYGQLYEEELLENDANWKADLPAYMATYFQTIEVAVKDLYTNQLVISIITNACFLVVIATWLVPRGTFWGFFIAFLSGSLVTWFLGYVINSVKIGTLFKVPIKASQSKEDLIKWIYGNGFILGLLIASVLTLTLLFVTLIMKALAIIKISPHHYAIEMLGYPTGSTDLINSLVLLAGIYFREGMSATGRGILAACDLMIKKDQYFGQIGNALSYTTKVAAGMASIIQDVNYFDCMLAIGLFLTAPQLVFINAEEYTIAENFLGKFFGLPLIFVISWVLAFATSFLINILKNDDAVTYTASNIRLQVLISLVFSCLCMILVLFAFPDKFEFGNKENPQIYREGIFKPQILGCGFIGIVASATLLITFEFLTSHGYSPVLNITQQSKNAPTLNIMNAYYLGWIGQFVPTFSVGLSLFLVYKLCALVGIVALMTGFMLNLLILMPIQFLGNVSHDGLKSAFLGQFSHFVIDRLHSVSWAARNYSVWVKISNAATMVIGSAMLIGAMIFYTKTYILLLNGYNLFGLMIGAGLAYFTKGRTLYIVKSLCEEALFDEKVMQNRKNKEDEEQALENFQYSYFPIKNRFANYHVLSNMSTCAIVVIITGILFGRGACISLSVSYLVTTAITSFSSIIIGNALKAAFVFTSYDQQLQDNSSVLATNLYGDIQGTAIEESTNVPSSYYLLFVPMVSMMGIELFQAV